jgi:hypothetical protein
MSFARVENEELKIHAAKFYIYDGVSKNLGEFDH